MSYFSKWVDRKLNKKGLTSCVMYIVKRYVKMTPSKIDDAAVAKVEAALRECEG
jgi:hypothetical protein